MEKRGLHSVIVTVLIISVALVSAVLLWAAIKAFYAESTEGVDVKVFTVGVEIVPKTLRSVSLGDSVGLSFYVRAGKGEGEIVALNVAAEDSGGNSKNYKYLFPKGNLKAYESEKVSVSYEGLKEITEVTVSAIFKNEEGKEIESKMSSVYKVKDSEGGASVTIGGLVGYWKFDELKGDIARDFSGNKFSANLKPSESGPSRAAKSSECVQNGCLFMDGTDDYLEVPYNEKLNPKKFSVMAWVKPVSSRESYQTVLVSQNPEAENKGLVLYTNPSNGASANVWQGGIIGGSKLSAVGGAMKSNEWVHLAMVYDGGKVSVYENGKIVPETQKYNTAEDYDLKVSLSRYGVVWDPKAESRYWKGLAVSSNGKYQTAIVYGGGIFTSEDYGATWTARDSNRLWTNIYISADGKYQTAVALKISPDYLIIYTSDDYGKNWNSRKALIGGGSIGIRAFAMSADGRYQTFYSGGRVYVSSDYGVNWKEGGYLGWSSERIAMSADGRYQTVIGSNGQIYVSSNSGDDWSPKINTQNFLYTIVMSSDGKYQTITGKDKIYISTNWGESWSETNSGFALSIYSFSHVASANGQYQSVISGTKIEYLAYFYGLEGLYRGRIYTSKDSGKTWTARDSDRLWTQIYMSADGKYQTALAYNGYIYNSENIGQIYISEDYGETWAAAGDNKGWIKIAGSSSGDYQVAVQDKYDKVYVSKAQVLDISSFFNIGAASTIQNNQQTPGMFFNGYLDEVMVFEKELTAEQIKSVYESF